MAQRVPPFESNAGKSSSPAARTRRRYDHAKKSGHINFRDAHRCLRAPQLKNAKHTRCIAFAGIKPPGETTCRQHRSRLLAQSRRRPDQDRLGRRAGSPGRGICYPRLRGHAIDGLLDILPDVLAGFGRSSGPVMNSVASRCARRGASGDHDQTKPLTPQPPFKTSRADLQLRRAAGARRPLIPARERPSRWPGFGQHG